MNTAHDLPTTIPAYLERLRQSLQGCDPALAQDALYDAEDYLRSELAANPGKSEADVIAAVAGSYGAPDEVADIYRDTEARVQTALRAPPPPPRKSVLGRFFGVLVDPHTYGSLFYMLLALATGTFYFTWAVTGLSLSLGLAILIIGIPFAILFIGATRVLALVEGRIVEVMLGERMPRRPVYTDRSLPWLQRIGAMFTDPRTWGTVGYFLAMQPLGVAYFAVAVTTLALGAGFIALPFAHWFGFDANIDIELFGFVDPSSPWIWPLSIAVGIVLIVAMLHLARLVGYLHGKLAKALLVSNRAW
ncbi:sensor domain-containing protein [Thermomonas sp.]|uniref:sensor domain-containing protein n=1 Tax=Thermomonas sp. TaxID=1971895 RepID=UPI0035B2A972